VDGESTCKRGSVHPLNEGCVAIHLSDLPREWPRYRDRPGGPPTFDLAPGGVYQATRVAPRAGALLPHRFTLTCSEFPQSSAVYSLWHFPARHRDSRFASTLPCGAPTFLTTPLRAKCDYPVDSTIHLYSATPKTLITSEISPLAANLATWQKRWILKIPPSYRYGSSMVS